MLLGKDQQLGAADLRAEVVPVPEWGGDVRIQGMMGCDRNSLLGESATSDVPRYSNWYGRVLVRCIVDEKGQRIYQDADAEALGRKNALVLERLFTVAARLSALAEADVEELAKNSESTPNGGTTSA